MSQQGKTFKHFVIFRFFPYKDPKFNQDIFDLDFIAHQVFLAKNNCIQSLENQSNTNFELSSSQMKNISPTRNSILFSQI